MNARVIVLGGGGHAKVLLDLIRLIGAEVIAVTDADPSRHGSSVLGHRIAGGDELVMRHAPGTVQLVNALGSINRATLARRRAIFERFKRQGYTFMVLVHPSAVVASSAIIEEGAQVMAGAVVQAGVRIGANTILNTRSSVDHDCVIGAHAHLAPGATISGGVAVEDEVHVGPGAVLIQGVRIGAGSVIAAGALVLETIPPGATVLGSRAKAAT